MRSILVQNPGPNSQLSLVEQDMPVCHNEQILIKVKATAVNRADIMQRMGLYPPPHGETNTPGLEVAGEVIAVGKNVHRFKIGDRVYGLVGSGGYSTHCLIHQNLAAPMPDDWDYLYAASIPEALITAHSTVFLLGKLQPEQTFLVHAAGSGIASFAIQMARTINAKVITTASIKTNMEKAIELGANEVINYKTEDFAKIVPDHSVDLILDFIGGDYFPKHIKLLKSKGTLIQIASLGGSEVKLDLAQLMRKRLLIEGFVLRSQTIEEKSHLWKSAQERWSAALFSKQVRPIIDSKFGIEMIEEAHQHLLGPHFGKIVVSVD